MISSIVIDGVLKLIQKRIAKNKGLKTEENVIRIYDPRSVVPEKVLYESKTLPGTYLDEVEDKVYLHRNNTLVQVHI